MIFRQHSFASSGTTLRTISFESTGREGVYTKYKGRVRARVVCRWLLDETRGRRCGQGCGENNVRTLKGKGQPGQIWPNQ